MTGWDAPRWGACFKAARSLVLPDGGCGDTVEHVCAASRSVAHPRLVEALLPLMRVLLCTHAPEIAALAEAYASRLRQYGVDVAPGTGACVLRIPPTPSLTRRAAACTSVWVADKTAVAHRAGPCRLCREAVW